VERIELLLKFVYFRGAGMAKNVRKGARAGAVGRPRAPEQLGPPRREPHQRPKYFQRLDAILGALEIPNIGRDERLFLQRIIHRSDMLRRVDPKRFGTANGDAQVILLLRLIAESANGPEALTLPILGAVSSCLHEGWINRGLEFFKAMDQVPLLQILATLASKLTASFYPGLHRRRK
jgi:hypothetical protein